LFGAQAPCTNSLSPVMEMVHVCKACTGHCHSTSKVATSFTYVSHGVVPVLIVAVLIVIVVPTAPFVVGVARGVRTSCHLARDEHQVRVKRTTSARAMALSVPQVLKRQVGLRVFMLCKQHGTKWPRFGQGGTQACIFTG